MQANQQRQSTGGKMNYELLEKIEHEQHTQSS